MSTAIQPLNLYDLTSELQELEHALLESGGVIDGDMEERYGQLLEMEADKVEGYVAVIRKFEASEETIKAERKRLQKAERAMKNAAKSLKDRLAAAMLQRGEEVHETKLGKIRLQKASRRSLVLDVDVEDLPPDFQRMTITADKEAIKAYLDEHGIESHAGVAHLDAPSYYVRIY